MAPTATDTEATPNGNANNNSNSVALAAPTDSPPHHHDPSPTLRFDTLTTHNAAPEQSTGALIPGIALATAYAVDDVHIQGVSRPTYTRFGNPNRNTFEESLAALEHGKHAIAFSSGTAVTTALVGLVGNGGHIVSVDSLYGGTHKIFTQIVSKTQGIETTFVDLCTPQGLEERVKQAVRVGQTKLLWIESPTNPDIRLVDIARVSKAAKAQDPAITVVVDSTFTSPWYQNPLELGADVVMHSVTKYLNGHTDVLMGVAIVRDDALASHLRLHQSALGAVPSPFDCWLATRGVKTLGVRMREHGRNALRLAQWLSAHPLVRDVVYPGLPSHPSFELVARQMTPRSKQAQLDTGLDLSQGIQYSGMLSFRLDCDPSDSEPGARLLKELNVITLALSLGGVESLIEQPSTMTHWMVPEEERLKLGIGHDLIRLSVGLEDVRDLQDDLDQALQKVLGPVSSTDQSQISVTNKKRKTTA